MFFIPIFYVFQGNKLSDPIIIYTSIYYVLISAFCALSSFSFIVQKADRTFRVHKMVLETVQEPRKSVLPTTPSWMERANCHHLWRCIGHWRTPCQYIGCSECHCRSTWHKPHCHGELWVHFFQFQSIAHSPDLQTTLLTINVMYRNGKKLRLFRRRSSKRLANRPFWSTMQALFKGNRSWTWAKQMSNS